MKKDTITTILLVLVLVIGLSLLLYPTVSDWWNTAHQSRAINNYEKQVEKLDTAAYEKVVSEAQAYNRTLLGRDNSRFQMTDQERETYNGIMDISGTGIMASIDIPSLGVTLPIYHGTSDGVLQVAVGHVEGSSLPVGGAGTHCVLSGHRGLPSAKLFTDLDKLKEGDTFEIRVLYDVLTYEIDQIKVVLPQEMDDLAITEDGDYCTLVTCTPYGINTHRLLVRGRRVENAPTEETQPEATQAAQPETRRNTMEMEKLSHVLILILALAVVLTILLIILLFTNRRKK